MATLQCFNEWITLADAHTLLGTTSPADDVLVQGMIDDIDALLVAYLKRNLKSCEHSEVKFKPTGPFIKVGNWPITTLTSVTVDGTAIATPENDFDIDEDLGMLYFRSDGLTFDATQPKEIVIVYEGGYDPPPLELQVMFRTLLSDRHAAGGAAPSGGVGEIKKVSLTGVAAVEFATTGTAVSYQGVDRLSGVPEELKPYVGLLDKYRSDELIGIV